MSFRPSATPILIAVVVASVLGGPRLGRAADPGPGAARFPNVSLVTHEGKTVRFYDDLVRGKTVLINFMYVNCDGICPGQTANLVEVQNALGERFGRDVFICSITLDPARDTPEVLSDYAQVYKTKPGWNFVTGAPEDLELLRRRLGFVDPDPEVDRNRSRHLGMVMIGNEPLSRWSACPALSEPSVLVELVGWMRGPEPASAADRAGGWKLAPKCPIDRGRGVLPVTFEGRTYHVCGTGCREQFEADPAAVLAGSARASVR